LKQRAGGPLSHRQHGSPVASPAAWRGTWVIRLTRKLLSNINGWLVWRGRDAIVGRRAPPMLLLQWKYYQHLWPISAIILP
jgi:hypothetical protein